jgi:hypothetical protein
MEDQKKKSLSEISHLFLSSVRENAAGPTRPMRIPPGGHRLAQEVSPRSSSRIPVSIDLTPEEYARVVSEPAESAEQPPYGAVSALICSQFNGQQLDRARQYAQHLAGAGQRVGLIVADAAEASVICFDVSSNEPTAEFESAAITNPLELGQALQELAWDVDRWLLLLPSARLTEARELLRKIDHWVLLSTCDHDGVVSCYRAIKGLAEMPRPRLTLALLNAVDQVEAGKVYRKIASVCEQFLNWKMEAEPAVETAAAVNENVAVRFAAPADRAAVAAANNSHWNVLLEFLSRAQSQAVESTDKPKQSDAQAETDMPTPMDPIEEPAFAPRLAEAPAAPPVRPVSPLPPTAPAPGMKMAQGSSAAEAEVTDLPGGEVTESAVLNAVINQMAGGLIQCPIRPPSCPQATIAVSRDHRLVLLAVANRGLGDLRAIALAYRWVIENRPLLSMAMPQFAIDAHAHPTLKLVVDRADAGAELLLPMTENSAITVQTYRKLRWAGKTGLLLEAA